MLAWHFLQNNKQLRWGTKRKVRVGQTITAEGTLKMCQNGMHASKRIIDALQYAPGAILCRVDLTGELQHENDKSVGCKRKVLWMIDATKVLHEFACRCAERALQRAKVNDKRCHEAIRIKRLWLTGDATEEELTTARVAAGFAAYNAASFAASFAVSPVATVTAY